MSRKVSLSVFIFVLLAAILVTFLSAFAVVSSVYDDALRDAYLAADTTTKPGEPQGDSSEQFPELQLLDSIFKVYGYGDFDEEAVMEAVLKAYVEATGDKYAEYYTAEEFALLTSDTAGDMQGIGVNIIYNADEDCIEIINVMPNSPALDAELLPGDLIIYVGCGDERKSVSELGYTMAVKQLQGKEGTRAEFVVRRGDREIEFSIERAHVQTLSVTYRVCATDPTVGIVKITEFDLTTPKQFSEAVDTLKSQGINKFVFDVRYNPGGDLQSIVAVLSYFLDKNDLIISTVDKAGNKSETRVEETVLTGDYAGCSVSAADIGKYKGLKCVVLANGSTASAAELFTSNFRDYKLAPIVGTTTFGKGCMQSILSLAYYGYEGGLRITTKMYFPPCGIGYHDIGIEPDIVVELDEALKDKNIYKITDAEDNQLQRALVALNESK